jgi:hypothetical protein
MEISLQKNIYDLVVIGNGIAAQSFLWNLSNTDSKSQNFSIAHVYSNEIAPPCSFRSSATVSLNGIEEDVSPLGNDMREAFFLFEDLYKKYQPNGVEVVTRKVIATNENDTKKLTRRYKILKSISSESLKITYPGAEYTSYIITPEVFLDWMGKHITVKKNNYPFFVRDISEVDGVFNLKLQSKEVILAKKILFATGAYAKIFEKFYAPPESASIENKNMIKAGSYLERSIDLGPKSFYLSIDGHQILYRKNSFEQKLIIGSVTTIGAYEAPDFCELNELFSKLKALVTFDMGNISDYKVVTGLRHKGPKRLAICEAIDLEKRLFRINGLYKNGYTLGLLAAKRMEKIIF